MRLLWFCLIVFGVVVGLGLLDQLGLWMERRGWIYWRKRRPGGGGATAATFSYLQTLVEPEVRHVIEAREEDRAASAKDHDSHNGVARS